MTIARVEAGVVLELRDMSMEDVPEHKRAIWRPVAYEGEGSETQTVVEPHRVRIVSFNPPTPAPSTISDRQFFQQLARLGVIAEAEALAAVGPGEVPAALSAMIDTMPEAERFPARMLLTGATQFDRNHPLVPMFAAAFGWSTDDINTFWTAAASL